MNRWRLTPDAVEDLQEIWSYIAQDNPAAADGVEADFYQAFDHLTVEPEAGHFRRDLTIRPIRFWTVRKNYLIAYRHNTEGIEILRVLHGSRDALKLL